MVARSDSALELWRIEFEAGFDIWMKALVKRLMPDCILFDDPSALPSTDWDGNEEYLMWATELEMGLLDSVLSGYNIRYKYERT